MVADLVGSAYDLLWSIARNTAQRLTQWLAAIVPLFQRKGPKIISKTRVAGLTGAGPELSDEAHLKVLAKPSLRSVTLVLYYA